MRVALTMRISEEARYVEPRDSISQDWLTVLGQWQATPLLVPNLLADPVQYLKDLNPGLLVMTGGDDLGVHPERDQTEEALLDYAIDSGLPVLGICRGLYAINNLHGGNTTEIEGHVRTLHELSISAPWQSVYGSSATVNSYHHQSIAEKGLGKGLVATATDGDGYIEAFCHRERPIAALMWHPEREGGPAGDEKLFHALVEHGAFWS
jgi:putative glutamine amidotransferase